MMAMNNEYITVHPLFIAIFGDIGPHRTLGVFIKDIWKLTITHKQEFLLFT